MITALLHILTLKLGGWKLRLSFGQSMWVHPDTHMVYYRKEAYAEELKRLTNK